MHLKVSFELILSHAELSGNFEIAISEYTHSSKNIKNLKIQ